jgi:hypothetical protein
VSELLLAESTLSHDAFRALVPFGKVYPACLFALTGNFYSTGPVSASDIAKKMALFHAHFIS